jgi:hypothetical protein
MGLARSIDTTGMPSCKTNTVSPPKLALAQSPA